jgi:hypothetical protein
LNISERIQAKKNLVDTLKKSPNKVNESINIPLKSMVSVANQTLKSYVDTMDENTKKDFLKVVTGNPKELETEFTTIKESAITKLQTILEGESEVELKTKISETIDKIRGEEFNQMNYVRISSLEKSI